MNLEDYAVELSDVKDSDLKKVGMLVRQQLVLEKRIADLEAELKMTTRELNEVSGELLPAALQEHGMTELKMHDGSVVTVATVISASISKERQPDAHEWLREHGHGDLIKNTVSLTFGRGEDDKADALLRELDAKGFDPEQKESVHAGTLKAFVKEQINEGREIPSELFGVYIGQKTTIKKGK
jgi:hypothetical protein